MQLYVEKRTSATDNFIHTSHWLRDVVVSGVDLINEVNLHRAQLVLGWVTVYGQVNHFGT